MWLHFSTHNRTEKFHFNDRWEMRPFPINKQVEDHRESISLEYFFFAFRVNRQKPTGTEDSQRPRSSWRLKTAGTFWGGCIRYIWIIQLVLITSQICFGQKKPCFARWLHKKVGMLNLYIHLILVSLFSQYHMLPVIYSNLTCMDLLWIAISWYGGFVFSAHMAFRGST